MFLFPRLVSFFFDMTLTFGLKVKLKIIFHWNKFCHNFVKSMRGSLINMSKSFIDRCHMTLLLLNFS